MKKEKLFTLNLTRGERDCLYFVLMDFIHWTTPLNPNSFIKREYETAYQLVQKLSHFEIIDENKEEGDGLPEEVIP